MSPRPAVLSDVSVQNPLLEAWHGAVTPLPHNRAARASRFSCSSIVQMSSCAYPGSRRLAARCVRQKFRIA